MTFDELTNVLNGVTVVIFFFLAAAVVLRMSWRLWMYRRLKLSPNVILRRDFAWILALLVVFGVPALIRAAGLQTFFATGFPRFFLVALLDSIGITALAYWTWVEFFVIGAPGKNHN